MRISTSAVSIILRSPIRTMWQHGFRLMVVDAGIDHDMDYSSGIINMKVRKGTRDFSQEAAITPQEFELCLERGAECVDKVSADGCNVISLGEMGCGNTSASSVWMNLLAGIPLAQCIGAGAGLDSQGVIHKLEVLLSGAPDRLLRLCVRTGRES